GAVGEIEQLPERDDLDHVHVGECSLEVGLGDTGERAEAVGARPFVVGDEALLDQQVQELFHGIGFGADGGAEPGGGHARVFPERIDDAELKTGQQRHKPRGSHHVFAKARECGICCDCTGLVRVGCHARFSSWSLSLRDSLTRCTFNVAVRGSSACGIWSGSASWGKSATAARQRSRSRRLSSLVQSTGTGSAFGPRTTTSSLSSPSLLSTTSSTSKVLRTPGIMSTSRSNT